MRVNISRTFMEASVSVTAPSGRVPFTGAASSGIGSSRETAAGFNEMRREMKNALDDVRGNGVVGARFADARREDETHQDAARFDLDVLRNELAECSAITTQDIFQVFLKHREHSCVRDNGVLDDFGEAAAKFAVWEGSQQLWVGEHQARRVECTDEIFSFG